MTIGTQSIVNTGNANIVGSRGMRSQQVQAPQRIAQRVANARRLMALVPTEAAFEAWQAQRQTIAVGSPYTAEVECSCCGNPPHACPFDSHYNIL